MKTSSKMSFLSLKSVKQKLRKMIFKKVLLLSVSYNKKVTPSRFLSSKPHIYRLDGGVFNCYNLYKWGGALKKTRLLKIVLKRTGAIKLLCSYVIVFFAVSVAIWIFEPNITRLFDSIWYCFSVATTIGLGDVLATTLVGRVLSIFLSICSILIIAVVPGVITSYYVESTKLRADESSAKFLDDLERLPELSKEELVELSEKVKKFNRKK